MSLIENWPIPVNECYGDVSPLERIAYRVVAPITSGLPTILELSRGGSNLMPSAATSADSSLYLQVSDAFPWDYNGAWMALTSGTKLGPYEIQSPLGTGGMGEVYRARDTRLDRTVAVKILSSHLSDKPEAKQRFEREARAISSLNHPNICTLYDVGPAFW